MKALKGIETPQKDQQNQITWTLGALRDCNTNQRAYTGSSYALHIYVANVQLSLYVSPKQLVCGATTNSAACL